MKKRIKSESAHNKGLHKVLPHLLPSSFTVPLYRLITTNNTSRHDRRSIKRLLRVFHKS